MRRWVRWVRPGHWVMNVLIALDQFWNAVLGGAPDETISSRAGRGAFFGKTISRGLCGILNWLEPGHCPHAVDAEIQGTQESEAIRDLRTKSG